MTSFDDDSNTEFLLVGASFCHTSQAISYNEAASLQNRRVNGCSRDLAQMRAVPELMSSAMKLSWISTVRFEAPSLGLKWDVPNVPNVLPSGLLSQNPIRIHHHLGLVATML